MYIPSPGFHRAVAMTLLIAGGCGELANQNAEAPPLATPSGSVDVASTSTAPEGPLRLALIWHVPQDQDPSEECAETEGRALPAAVVGSASFSEKSSNPSTSHQGFPAHSSSS